MTSAVQPEKILRELTKLWVDLGHEEGVLRACAMTLIVACEGSNDVEEAGEALAELMREHPSRAIVLRVLNEEEPKLESRVFAQCWMPFGRRQQICCDQIEISATKSRLSDVYSAMLGLTVPDLPVILWLRCGKLIKMPEFQPLLHIARSVIIDSSTLPSATEALALLETAHNEGWRVKDLAWTRITRWREIVAQTFENPAMRARAIKTITVRHSGDKVPAEAYYAGAWLAARLPDAKLLFAPAISELNCGLQGLLFEGPDFHVSITPSSASALDIMVDTFTGHVVLPELAPWQLVEEELSILGNDPVYECTIHQASALARSPQ